MVKFRWLQVYGFEEARPLPSGLFGFRGSQSQEVFSCSLGAFRAFWQGPRCQSATHFQF